MISRRIERILWRESLRGTGACLGAAQTKQAKSPRLLDESVNTRATPGCPGAQTVTPGGFTSCDACPDRQREDRPMIHAARYTSTDPSLVRSIELHTLPRLRPVSRNRRLSRSCAVLLLILSEVFLVHPSAAADRRATQSPDDSGGSIQTASVTLDGQVLFKVRGVTAYPAERRAGAIRDRLERHRVEPCADTGQTARGGDAGPFHHQALGRDGGHRR